MVVLVNCSGLFCVCFLISLINKQDAETVTNIFRNCKNGILFLEEEMYCGVTCLPWARPPFHHVVSLKARPILCLGWADPGVELPMPMGSSGTC